jgi:hypothetical protein
LAARLARPGDNAYILGKPDPNVKLENVHKAAENEHKAGKNTP